MGSITDLNKESKERQQRRNPEESAIVSQRLRDIAEAVRYARETRRREEAAGRLYEVAQNAPAVSTQAPEVSRPAPSAIADTKPQVESAPVAPASNVVNLEDWREAMRIQALRDAEAARSQGESHVAA